MTKEKTLAEFSPQERDLLRAGFMDFGDTWNITVRLLKREFKRVLLPVFFYKLLLAIVGLASLGLLGTLLLKQMGGAIGVRVGTEEYRLNEWSEIIETTRSSISQNDYSETEDLIEITTSADQIAELIVQNSGQFFGIGVAVFLTLLGLAWYYHYFHLRTFEMLSQPSQQGVLNRTPGIFLVTTRFLTVQILVAMIGGTVQESLLGVVGVDAASLYGYLVQFLFYSLAGLYVYELVEKRLGIVQSIRLAYKMVIEVYWQNVFALAAVSSSCPGRFDSIAGRVGFFDGAGSELRRHNRYRDRIIRTWCGTGFWIMFGTIDASVWLGIISKY